MAWSAAARRNASIRKKKWWADQKKGRRTRVIRTYKANPVIKLNAVIRDLKALRASL